MFIIVIDVFIVDSQLAVLFLFNAEARIPQPKVVREADALAGARHRVCEMCLLDRIYRIVSVTK